MDKFKPGDLIYTTDELIREAKERFKKERSLTLMHTESFEPYKVYTIDRIHGHTTLLVIKDIIDYFPHYMFKPASELGDYDSINIHRIVYYI